MSGRHWYQDREPVSFEVETGSAAHRVTWRRGKLILHDHDLAAERVLLALGGEPCPCLLVLDVVRDRTGYPWRGEWRMPSSIRAASPAAAHVGTLMQTASSWRSVAVGRPVGAGIPAPGQLSAREMLERLRNDPALSAAPREHRDIMLAQWKRRLLLETVPPEMLALLGKADDTKQARRVRSTAVQRRPKRDAQELLQAAAAPAFEEAMRHSRRDLRPYASITVEIWKQKADELALLKGNLTSTGGFAALSLPASWLNRVWRRGFAIVEGHFVLDADGSAPATESAGEAVIWNRQLGNNSVPVAAPCSLRQLDGRWRLFW